MLCILSCASSRPLPAARRLFPTQTLLQTRHASSDPIFPPRRRYKEAAERPPLPPSYLSLPPGRFGYELPSTPLSKRALQRQYVDEKLSILEIIEHWKREAGSTEDEIAAWNLNLIPLSGTWKGRSKGRIVEKASVPKVPTSHLVEQCPEYRHVLSKLLDTVGVLEYLTEKFDADRNARIETTMRRGVLQRALARDGYKHLGRYVAKLRWEDGMKGWGELEDAMLEEVPRYLEAAIEKTNQTRALLTRTGEKTTITPGRVLLFPIRSRPRFSVFKKKVRTESEEEAATRMLHHLVSYVSLHPEDVKARDSLTSDIENYSALLRIRDGAHEHVQNHLAKRRFIDGSSWAELDKEIEPEAGAHVAEAVRKANESTTSPAPFRPEDIGVFDRLSSRLRDLTGRRLAFDPEDDKPCRRLRILYHLCLFVVHNPSDVAARTAFTNDIDTLVSGFQGMLDAKEQEAFREDDLDEKDRLQIKRWLMAKLPHQRVDKRPAPKKFLPAGETVEMLLRTYRSKVVPRTNLQGDGAVARKAVEDVLEDWKTRARTRSKDAMKSYAAKNVLVFNMTPDRLAYRKERWTILATRREQVRLQVGYAPVREVEGKSQGQSHLEEKATVGRKRRSRPVR